MLNERLKLVARGRLGYPTNAHVQQDRAVGVAFKGRSYRLNSSSAQAFLSEVSGYLEESNYGIYKCFSNIQIFLDAILDFVQHVLSKCDQCSGVLLMEFDCAAVRGDAVLRAQN
ncbi:hypothetical protein CRYUN_Cryun03dG0035200 [Craigia yunnanensis]